MLKSSEHEKLWRNSNYGYANLEACSDIRSVDPSISFYCQFLRRGGSGSQQFDKFRFKDYKTKISQGQETLIRNLQK